MTEVFSFIRQEKANYPVAWMCRMLGAARASFYRWLHPRPPTPTQERHLALIVCVRRMFESTRGMAGRDQLVHLLRAEGIPVSTGTVGAIMRELGLRAIRMQAWKKTTVRDPAARTAHIRNHMLDQHGRRDFTSHVPGTLLCGDISYLSTNAGRVYLATVIDLHNREVIGWAVANHMRVGLVIDALAMAREHGRLGTDDVIFHSDRGSQYTSNRLQQWCEGNGITQSMGEVGVCWDNAVAESFFSHFKTEMFHHTRFANILTARTAIMEYIEIWYNRKRPHRHNGGLSPTAARTAYETRVNNTIAA